MRSGGNPNVALVSFIRVSRHRCVIAEGHNFDHLTFRDPRRPVSPGDYGKGTIECNNAPKAANRQAVIVH